MRPIIKILAFFIVLIFLLPAVELGSFNFKPDLLLACLLGVIMLVAVKSPVNRLKQVNVLWLLTGGIFLIMFISDNLGYYYFKNDYTLYFPREFIQVLARVSVFIGFMYIGYEQLFKKKFFIQMVSVIFLLSLVFGVLQKFGAPIVRSITVDYYALSETQVGVVSSSNSRVLGTAGNALTWGGVSMMMFLFFYFVPQNRWVKITGASLAVLNVFFSGSRAAIVAVLFSYFFIQIFRALFVEKRITKSFVRIMGVAIIIIIGFLVINIYLAEQLDYVLFRFNNTRADLTQQGRGAQLQYYLHLFKGQEILYILGIGKPAMDSLKMMEVEFTYLLFAYGILGFSLHYFILYSLLKLVRKFAFMNSSYYLFIVASLMGFMVFSVGFYFFREIIGGLSFWWLAGYMVGVMMKEYHFLKTTQGNKQSIWY